MDLIVKSTRLYTALFCFKAAGLPRIHKFLLFKIAKLLPINYKILKNIIPTFFVSSFSPSFSRSEKEKSEKKRVDFLIDNLYLPTNFLLSLGKKGYLTAVQECYNRGFFSIKNIYKLFCSENEDIFIFLRKKNVCSWSSAVYKKCSVRTFKLFNRYNKVSYISRTFNKVLRYENRPLIEYILNKYNMRDHFKFRPYDTVCGKSIEFLIYLFDLGIPYMDLVNCCYCSHLKKKCLKCKALIKLGEVNEINTAFLRAVSLEDIDNINYYIEHGATVFKKALKMTRIRKIRSIIKLAMV